MAQLTEFLHAASARDDPEASKRLFDLVYADLKRLAHSNLRRSNGVQELNTTALVHESFIKFMQHGSIAQADRASFFAYVGRVMRSVVVDYVRERQASKRGGDKLLVTLATDVADGVAVDDRHLLAIHEALAALEKLSPELMRLVEMRFFAGLSVAEIAEVTGRSTRTVEREWEKARALLRKLMDET
jgi:RNA polymerase sigma factor (TIGR02999 family)